MNKIVSLLIAVLLTGCAQGSRVTTGPAKYPRVAKESVQVLFSPPSRSYVEIGMAMAQGAQLATDATAIEEVRSQAAKLGADAVIIAGMQRRAYASMPGMVNIQSNSSVYGNVNPYGGFNAHGNTQTTGIVSGPRTFTGTHVTGVAIKFVAPPSSRPAVDDPPTQQPNGPGGGSSIEIRP